MNLFRKMKRAQVLIGLLAALLVIGCAAGVQMSKASIQDPGHLLFNGHTKPEVDCFRCHNGDGRGSGRGPDLSKAVPKMPAAQVLKIIAQGSGFMPAFGNMLTKGEQEQILAWLRSAFGGQPAAQPIQVQVEAAD